MLPTNTEISEEISWSCDLAKTEKFEEKRNRLRVLELNKNFEEKIK